MGKIISRIVACIHFVFRNSVFAIYLQQSFKTTLALDYPATSTTQKWNYFHFVLLFRIQEMIYGHKIELQEER